MPCCFTFSAFDTLKSNLRVFILSFSILCVLFYSIDSHSNSNFNAIFQHHSAVMLIIEPKTGKIIEANSAAQQFYGFSIEQFTSMNIQDINLLSPEQVAVEIDEPLLNSISEITNGKYFRAKNEKELQSIYSEIDLLEKSKVSVIEFKTDPPEKYYGFLFIGLLLLLGSKLISNTLLKSIN